MSDNIVDYLTRREMTACSPQQRADAVGNVVYNKILRGERIGELERQFLIDALNQVNLPEDSRTGRIPQVISAMKPLDRLSLHRKL